MCSFFIVFCSLALPALNSCPTKDISPSGETPQQRLPKCWDSSYGFPKQKNPLKDRGSAQLQGNIGASLRPCLCVRLLRGNSFAPSTATSNYLQLFQSFFSPLFHLLTLCTIELYRSFTQPQFSFVHQLSTAISSAFCVTVHMLTISLRSCPCPQTPSTIEVALFGVFVFWMTELLNPKSSETGKLVWDDYRFVASPWGFHPVGVYFSPYQFLGEVFSSQIEKYHKTSGTPLS